MVNTPPLFCIDVKDVYKHMLLFFVEPTIFLVLQPMLPTSTTGRCQAVL